MQIGSCVTKLLNLLLANADYSCQAGERSIAEDLLFGDLIIC